MYTVDMYDVIITITTITTGECWAHTAITVSVTNEQLNLHGYFSCTII